MQKPQPSVDVVVAGAGPVGLFLACELALANCSVLVLEREPDPHSPLKQLPFGMRGLSAPTVEALYRRGLLDQLEVPKRLKHPFGGGHFAGIPFRADPDDRSRWPWRLRGSPEVTLVAEMAELESVLAARAEALGVRMLRGFPVDGFEQDGEGVEVRAGELTVRGRWLVGCDGARSSVRKAAGFEFAGTEPEFTGYSVRAEVADPSRFGTGRQLTPKGMVFQPQPGYLVIQEYDGGAAHGAHALTRERLQAVLRRVSGLDVTITALHAASTWTDRARQATRYRNGRVLLAGDAAHIHAPLGGQGLNLGIGDAMNLGWKLAATIHGTAPEGLLDSYEAERHPVGARVLDWSRAQVVLMRPDPWARALRTIVTDLIATGDGAACMAGRAWGTEIRYDCGDSHPLVGRSAPDVEFEDGPRLGALMGAPRTLLLDFGAHASLRALADEHRAIEYVRAMPKEGFGPSAMLVRPDGIVAWASGERPDPEEARSAASAWLRFR